MQSSARILIIDAIASDYQRAKSEILKVVSNCQFQCVEKQSTFLNALESFQPDLIVSEYKLRDFDAMTVLSLIRELWPHIPVIILTGEGSEEITVECIKKGASNYVHKANIQRLGSAIIQALEGKKALPEHSRVEETISSLSSFPEENPNPILRTGSDGCVIYANPASQIFLDKWGSAIGGYLPFEWKEIVADVYRSNLKRSIDLSIGDDIYSIQIVPVRELGYLSLYGYEITERSQAEQELRKQSQTAMALYETTRDLVIEQDLAKLLYLIVERATRLLNVESGGLYLCEPDLGQVRCVVSYNTPRDFTGITLKYGEGAAGLVAKTGQPLILDNYSTWNGRAKIYADQKYFAAVLSVPIKWQDKVIGVLHALAENKERRFYENDLTLLISFANQAAIAIQNASLHSQLERQNRVSLALKEATLPLIKELDISEVLQKIIVQAAHLLDASHGFIYLVEPDGSEIQLRTGLGKFTEYIGRRLKPGEGVGGSVWQTGKPLIVQDYHTWSGRSKQFDDAAFQSVIGIPLVSGARIIGVLGLTHLESSRVYSNDDLELLNRFAQLASIALENARLYTLSQQELTERKQVEVALRESDAKAKALLNALPDLMFRLDREGTFLDYKAKDEDLYDQSQPTLIGRKNRDLTPPEFSNLIDHYIHRTLNSGVMQVFEYELPLPERGRRNYEARMVTSGTDEVIAVVRDITDRNRVEQELRNAEERFQLLANNIQEVFWITDANSGEEIYISPGAQSIWGYPGEDLKNNPSLFFESIIPEDKQWVLENIEKQRGGQRTDIEYRMMHPDGSIHWIWDRAFPVFDENGKVKVLTGIAANITERKQAEAKLRDSEEKFSNAFEFAPIGKALVSLDGRFLKVNNALCSLLGYTKQELLQKTFQEITHPEDLEKDLNYVRQVLTGELISYRMEKRYFHKTGKDIWVLLSVSLVKSSNGEPEYFIAQIQDLTQYKQSKKDIERRLSELNALYENGLAIGQLLQPAEIGRRIIETFARYLSWHHVVIRLLQLGTNQLEVIAFNQPGLREEEKAEMEYHFNQMVSGTEQGLSGWVVQTETSLRTGNVHAHPQYVNTQAGIQSGLYMPLKIGERVIGVISVESEAPDAFTEQDERLLSTFGNQAAMAFENARLYQAANQEILERTRTQEALWASEAHYHELADSITDVLFELDPEFHVTHWNKSSEMLLGIPQADAIGRSMDEILGGSEDWSVIRKIFEDVLAKHQTRTFETKLSLQDQKLLFDVSAYPSMRGVSVVARDISERKLSESIVQKRLELMEYSSHHSLEEVMRRTIDTISEITESHIGFLHFIENDETTINLQTWSTETIEKFCRAQGESKHYPVDRAGVWADAVRQRRAVIHNDLKSMPGRKGLPEGHADVIREIVIPIFRSERLVAVLGVGNKTTEYTQHDVEIAGRFADYAWDITERKRMENILADERKQLAQRVEERTADLSRANSNLARALKVKDEFLANMSHELRTPLNAILGLSESLSEQVAGPLNEKQQKYLNTINESGHHLLSLINDILDLAKIEAGQITLDINKVDVNSVCQASLRMIKQLTQKKNQDVQFEIDRNLGLMWADERRLKQMIVNLLSNAVKFTPEAGKLGLEVHGDQADNRVIISVWDNGIGISEQDLDRLFKPFVQLDAGLAREVTGTGLGLALVAQMARLHGGSVSVESKLGAGSRFSIQLPWEPAIATDVSIRLRNTAKFRAIDPKQTNKPTLLIIEDTLEVVMMLTDYLEMNGFKIVAAQNGTDGIAQAKLTHPDLILMDIMMPGMDGFETTQKLRMDPEFRNTPIIALTALAMPSDRQRCMDAGMDEYLSKPVNLKALVKLIQSILLDKEDGKPK